MVTDEIFVSEVLLNRIKKLHRHFGNTPLHHFSRMVPQKGVMLFAKKEWQQMGGSVKTRAAYYIFRSAIEFGWLNEHKTLLDATSGNTGISYAALGKELGIPVTLCLPENASSERKEILKALGAEIIYTSRFEGTDGAQQVARELAEQYPDKYFYADQYKNDNNWKAHYHTTAVEIYHAIPGITHFVAGLGTSGTFVGTGRRLKEYNPNIKLISLQPDSAMHALEGWKHMETAMVPAIYDDVLADETAEVSTEEAFETLVAIYQQEGLLVSPSSAANIAGAIRIANSLKSGIVVTVMPDNSDKYSDIISRLF
ncbi:MAG TPA: cysteine synthase family protein [Ferruginibacter sp.]|nr:cysteine synthase family protein [Ferruginibacter sp.]